MGWFADNFDPIATGAGIVGSFIQGQQNLKFQKENLAYQKQLQQQIFDREDNAVQRRAADLEKAGLSKTLAAGEGAGAGSVVSTTAPQNDSMSRAIQALNIRQTLANVKMTEQQAVNEVKRGKTLDEDVITAQENQALTRAKTAFELGNASLLGVRRQEAEQAIAEARARTQKYIDEHELFELQKEGLGLDNVRKANENSLFDLRKEGLRLDNLGKAYVNQGTIKNNVLLGKKQEQADTYNQIMEAQLAGVLLENNIRGLDYAYQKSTGLKPGSGGQYGELAGGLGYMAGRLWNAGANLLGKIF